MSCMAAGNLLTSASSAAQTSGRAENPKAERKRCMHNGGGRETVREGGRREGWLVVYLGHCQCLSILNDYLETSGGGRVGGWVGGRSLQEGGRG